MKSPNRETIILVAFFVILSLLIIFHNSPFPQSPYYFVESIRLTELAACLICCLVFGWVVINEKGRIFKGALHGFYIGNETEGKKNNMFYCWLMFFTAISIILLDIHLLNSKASEPANISNALKVWEIAAYLVTWLYTNWFWLTDDRGWSIIANLKDKKSQTSRFLIIANVLLLLFAGAHTVMFAAVVFFKHSLYEVIEEYEILISLLLIIGLYFLFCMINKRIIEHAGDDETKRDFKTMHKYIDNPTRAIFIILLVIAVYAKCLGCLNSMANFFSGAIAFELILSSIVWSNTNTF